MPYRAVFHTMRLIGLSYGILIITRHCRDTVGKNIFALYNEKIRIVTYQLIVDGIEMALAETQIIYCIE